jgi:acylglycerol lipase
MSHNEGTFTGQGGILIAWQAWLPPMTPKAVIVVAHGFGEHIGRYQNLVNAVLPLGYAVYGPDHRGHGRSGGTRALIDRYDSLLDDLDQVFDMAAAAHPGVPTFLLGHSMGGSIALASALRNQGRLAGLVLSGPAVTNHGVPKALAVLAKILARLAPTMGAKQLDPSTVSRDPAVVAAYVADPLVWHGKMPAGTGAALIERSNRFQREFATLRVPLLVVHGSADKLVSVASGKSAYALAGSPDKELQVYDGLAHEVMNEPEHANVLEDITGWLERHVP